MLVGHGSQVSSEVSWSPGWHTHMGAPSPFDVLPAEHGWQAERSWVSLNCREGVRVIEKCDKGGGKEGIRRICRRVKREGMERTKPSWHGTQETPPRAGSSPSPQETRKREEETGTTGGLGTVRAPKK